MELTVTKQVIVVDRKKTGQRIRRLRIRRDFSLQEVAVKVHTSRSLLSLIERGERPVSPKMMRKIERVLR